jgi:hypothetical protein
MTNNLSVVMLYRLVIVYARNLDNNAYICRCYKYIYQYLGKKSSTGVPSATGLLGGGGGQTMIEKQKPCLNTINRKNTEIKK